MKATYLIRFCVAVALTLAACSARRSEPLTGSAAVGEPRLQHGRVVFMQYCQKCHPGGEAGLGPSINDKPLPEFLMKTQVRVGLGAMPSFSEHEISGRDLDDLIRYLKGLRGKPQRL
jgi:mono/diheme cytochrome c family protein